MLADAKIYAIVPVKDSMRAQKFYMEKLGLEPYRDVPGGVIYRGGEGTMFQMYETPNAGTAQNTTMGWSVSDLDDTIAKLRANGVEFEKYDMPGVDPETGIITTDGMRAIWFKDTEGNILCLSQTG